jgi:hypothetical protein
VLSVSSGSWTNSPTSYTHQWLICDANGENCSSPAGETGVTYVLPAAAVGKTVRCWTTAKNATGDSTPVRTAPTALVTGAVVPPPTPPPTGGWVFNADFEGGNFVQVISQQESSAGRISLVSGIAWGGMYTAKTLIGPGDVGVAGSGGSYRTEMLVANISGAFGFPSLQGHDTWITWDTLLDPSFELPTDPNAWLLFTQFWTPGLVTGSPCFAVNVAQGQMYLTRRGGTPSASNERVLGIGAVPLNQRLAWKVHHRWSSGTGGLVEVWRNGVKVLSGDTLPNCAVGYEHAVEFKIGTYRSAVNPPSRDSYTLVDNIRFYTSDPG